MHKSRRAALLALVLAFPLASGCTLMLPAGGAVPPPGLPEGPSVSQAPFPDPFQQPFPQPFPPQFPPQLPRFPEPFPPPPTVIALRGAPLLPGPLEPAELSGEELVGPRPGVVGAPRELEPGEAGVPPIALAPPRAEPPPPPTVRPPERPRVTPGEMIPNPFSPPLISSPPIALVPPSTGGAGGCSGSV